MAPSTEPQTLATGATYSPATGRWQLLPAFPLPDISGATVTADSAVWTGSSLVVVANYGQVAPPADRIVALAKKQTVAVKWRPGWTSWRIISHAPTRIGGQLTGGLWTGSRLVLAESNITADVAPQPIPGPHTFDVAARRWLPIPLADIQTYPRKTAWTGQAVFALSLGGGQASAFNPSTDAWIPLPRPPDPIYTTIVWTGHEILVLGEGTTAGGPKGPNRAEAFVPSNA